MQQLGEFVVNHWVLFAALTVILALLIANLASGLGAASGQLSPPDAVRLINREDAVIVDLREAGEFNRGHILNAVNVPEARLNERLTELRKYRDRPVIVYCAAGNTAARAAAALKKAGFTKLYSLRGGIGAWQQDNLPIARGKP